MNRYIKYVDCCCYVVCFPHLQALSQSESAEQDKVIDENTGVPTLPKVMSLDCRNRYRTRHILRKVL